VPELADIGEVGSIVGLDDGIELRGGDAIEHAAYQAARDADGALIGVARERAFEQEQIGAVHQEAFEIAVKLALQRIERVVQRAAMRGVDAYLAAGARP
jgi:hypothetical protein